MRRHLIAIAVILTVATGCDNVAWGGIDVELRPPPTTEQEVPLEVTAEEAPPAPSASGPVLFAGLRDGPRATLAVVGEIDGDGLASFPDEAVEGDQERLASLTAPGAELTLFSEGVRVGTMTIDESDVATEFCPARAVVSGVVELVPTASGAERFLAITSSVAEAREYAPFRALAHVYDQRVASLSLASAAIPRLGAAFPAGGVLSARRDIQAFQMEGVTGPTIAATFVYRDELAVAQPEPGAYALFLLGAQAGDTYREAYAWYRAVDTDGKGAPSYFGHLDWNDDGEAELLLDVFGSTRRWYAALARRGGQWVRTYQDSCGPSAGG